MDENKKKEPIAGRWAGKRPKQPVSPLPTASKPLVAQIPFRAPIKPPLVGKD